jgi:hypothetical protein
MQIIKDKPLPFGNPLLAIAGRWAEDVNMEF